MPNLTPFEIALLILCAVLIVALGVILWWRLAGDRVKALIAGWMALLLFWKIVLPVVFAGVSAPAGEVFRSALSEKTPLADFTLSNGDFADGKTASSAFPARSHTTSCSVPRASRGTRSTSSRGFIRATQ